MSRKKKVKLTYYEIPPKPMSEEEHDRLLSEAVDAWAVPLLRLLKEKQLKEGGSIPTMETARQVVLYWTNH